MYAVVCEFQWNCTDQNENGQRYIPSKRNMNTSNAGQINLDPLHVYRVSNLQSDNCSDGRVTAVEYCYRYRTDGEGQPSFNWTLVVGSNLVINNIYALQSFGSTRGSSARCRDGNGIFYCCDTTDISFDLPVDFFFGATASAQGNTREAALLASNDITVSDKLELNRDTVTLSVGSTIIPANPPVTAGILLLWFLIGK